MGTRDDRESVYERIMNISISLPRNNFCVYYHKHKGNIFYIGMGSLERPFAIKSRSDRWKKFIETISDETYEIQIVRFFSLWREARDFEIAEIERLQPQVNIDGNKNIPKIETMKVCGYRITEAHFTKIRKVARRLKLKEAEALRKIIEKTTL